MARLYGSVRLRPTRIGFLVRPTQENHHVVRRFMRLCCCLWGGAFNPIIPVAKVLPSAWRGNRHAEITGPGLAEAYVRFFEPDVFVEAESGLAKETGIVDEVRRLGRGRVVTLDNFVESKEVHRPDFAYGLNIFDLYKHRYEQEFQFVSRHRRPYASFAPHASHDAFTEAVFGMFPEAKDLAYISKGFADVFDPTELKCTPKTCQKFFENSYISPLQVSRYGVEFSPTGHTDPTVFVFDPTKTIDLIDFWNLRQFRSQVLPIPLNWLGDLSRFVRRRIKADHRPLPNNRNGVMIHTTVEFSRSISDNHAGALAREHLASLAKDSWALKSWYDPIWRPPYQWRHGTIQPRRTELTSDTKDFEVDPYDGDGHVRVPALYPNFAERYHFGTNHARWSNVVTFSHFGQESEFALSYLPNVMNSDTARLTMGGFSVVTREGIVLPQRYKSSTNSVLLKRQQDAICSWMRSKGFAVLPSAAGQNANQVIKAVGSLPECSILADEKTLRLLEKMSRRQNRTAAVSEWKALLSNRKKLSTYFDIDLDIFAKRNVLRLGVVVSCPHCEFDNWYGLDKIGYNITCERCLASFDFPQGNFNFREKAWRYRSIGPFSLPNYAQGAYSTVLTLRALKMLQHFDAAITYSTGLEQESKFEADFIAWYQEGKKFWIDPEPELIIGENKSFGGFRGQEGENKCDVFEEEDILRFRHLAKAFPGAHFLFSTLKQSLGDDEKDLLRSFAEWGRRPLKTGQPRASVIVFTSTELFAEWDLQSSWSKLGGRHAELSDPAYIHLDDLFTLGDLTQQLYLGMPSYDAWRHARFRRRQDHQKRQQN
ncbi:hypothetical protein [Shumkonia mesophila]|uniref:hypothetical protein n=1 Tax=Shumkonia mesophila TaxID=2838854 RepID=UPI002934C41A|nr:hypothetical protein [Shumkonia mesophila]